MKKIIELSILTLLLAFFSCKSAGPERAERLQDLSVVMEEELGSEEDATSKSRDSAPKTDIYNATKEKLNEHEAPPTDEVIMDEIEIISYKEPLISYDETQSGRTLKAKNIEALPTKSISALAAKTAGVTVSEHGDISIRGSRPDATVYYIDGVRVKADASTMVPQAIIEHKAGELFESKKEYKEVHSDAFAFSEDLEIEPPRTEAPPPPPAPEAGLLTAGEWNDLKNWDKWLELQESGAYQTMVDYWNLADLRRQSVFVTNEDDIPLANQKVELVTESGQVLWTAITDNSGSAELFVSEEITEAYELVIAGGQEVYELSELPGPSTNFRVDQACLTESTTDLMFVVDATGSMQDEIDFLRAELGSVIERVEAQADEAEAEIRVGTVFYKDTYDDYVTAISPLDFDLNTSLDFIRSKDAGGGGDTPEAVDAALELALEQDWNKSATNRLLFLILDAPPHHNAEVLKKLEQQIRKAAALGIKIIPITASGIYRETEYLMKQMAVLTNGTYIFLTDDSGIGAPHLEHVVPDYEVELLNDLLVRVISGYSVVHDCEQPIVQEIITPIKVNVKVFPNPTSGQITVTTNTEVDKIIVTSTSGKTLFTVDEPALSERLDLSALISGMYQVSCIKDGERVSMQQLIKI